MKELKFYEEYLFVQNIEEKNAQQQETPATRRKMKLLECSISFLEFRLFLIF
jgi:hypothetical protein